MRPYFYIFLIAIALAIAAGIGATRENTVEYQAPVPTSTPQTNGEYQPRTARLLFMGDIMLDRDIERIALANNDPAYHISRISSTLQTADVRIANLESIISTRGEKMGSKYSFRAEPQMIDALTSANINVVSLANNHIWDYGPDAVTDTLQRLENANTIPVGAALNYQRAHKGTVIKKNGVAIGFLAYTDLISPYITGKHSSPAVAYLRPEDIVTDIRELRQRADIIVVMLHWGEEYETQQSPSQITQARIIADAGADIIIGHHPHVIQGFEKYNNTIIAYSLGNFIFDQNFSEDTSRGLIVEAEVSTRGVENYSPRIIYFDETYRPYVPN